MWLWLTGFLLLLCLLLFSPLVFIIEYAAAPRLTLRYLLFKFRLYPQKERPKAPKKRRGKPVAKAAEPKKKKIELPSSFFELLSLVLKLASGTTKRLVRLFKSITIKNTSLTIAVGGEDAAEAAISAGRMNAYIFSAAGVLANCFNFRRPNVCIYPDYNSQSTDVTFSTRVAVRPASILRFAASEAVLVVGSFLELRRTQARA